MDIESVLKLIDAGFTKEDIINMNNNKPVEPVIETKTENVEIESEKKNLETDSMSTSENIQSSNEQTINNNEIIDSLKSQINDLKDLMIKTNINNTEMPVAQKETLVDIMNKIINN